MDYTLFLEEYSTFFKNYGWQKTTYPQEQSVPFFSICSLLSVSVIFLCSNLISKEKLKNFSCWLFLIKAIVMFLLFILNGTGLKVVIKFFIMVDYVIDVELWISLYPLIALIKKDDKIYAIKSLIYDACYYIGVFLTGILLGKTFGLLKVTYNFYILVACIITFLTFILLQKTDLTKYSKKEEKQETTNQLKTIVSKIKKDKISKNYLLYCFLGEVSYSCITELQILILVDYLHFSPSFISNYSIILGISAVLIGSFVIAKFTFKNNYINILIKYGTRLLLYLIAFLSNQRILILLSFIFVALSSDSYLDITDAPYVNRFQSEEQLAFNNLKEMIEYIGTSIGIFFCGIALAYGVRFIFLVGSLFITLQIIFAFQALSLKNKEVK